jgi:photosynthetic reaction center cytochrome c subunit
MRKLTWSFVVLAALAVPTFLLAQEGGGKKKGNDAFTGNYKNLKVLKPEQVQPVMMATRAGLGQQCSFCHVQGDWANDSKPEKATAVMMISMVADINAKFADGKMHVTCYTCHRGEAMPVMMPPAADAPPAR